jgi:F-type H+-transporting ATPase subunit gamma
MSKRHEVERYLRGLGEIKDILSAMKNLSLIEVRKLTRFLSTQRRVVASIESAAADFLQFYPHSLVGTESRHNVYLLVGSERGFCGDFNEALLAALEANLHGASQSEVTLVVIGRRLSDKLAGNPRVAVYLDGPSVVEEVKPVLIRLMETINTLKTDRGPLYPLRLTVLHHGADDKGIGISVFQPFKQFEGKGRHFSHPPRLNLSEALFLTELAEHYLFHHLHELFYNSLMAENLRRLQHMDNAIQKIEKDSIQLLQKRNVLRQEEITEEIEIIMLSVEAMKKA